jgi:outer membrane receptor protein involved in Fe transport
MRLEASKATRAASIVLFAWLALLAPPLAFGQDTAEEDTQEDATEPGEMEEVTVTGSRIKRSPADQMAPIGTIGAEEFDERGYVTAAEALNAFTSNVPVLNQAPGNGDSSGTGQQFPNLFGLGSGRTLTLVNGHRFVTSSVGLGDAQVDANIVPTGLIERIEVVQAGGAAVYGSDAIAGVVNYILKEDFEGLEVDAQYGDSRHGDYDQENYRVTWGQNFDDNRGNVAINAEYASTPLLRFSDRERSNLSRITQGNPADTGPNDGIPSVQEILDAHFWNFNGNGIVYNIPAPPPFALTRIDGAPIQFAPDGSLIPYDPGQILGIPFAKGGDGFRYSELAGLRTGVERKNVMMVGHYDLTERVRLRAELLYANTKGEEIPQGFPRTVLNGADPLQGAIMIFNFNPFLTPEARTALSAASPAFAAGAPLWLSRHFYYDLFPSNIQETETDTYFGLFGADGDFDAAERNWYWTAHATFGRVEGKTQAWNAHNAHFNNAVFAVPGPQGPACLINVDGNPTNDDPACAPLNPFGAGNISPAAAAYVSVLTGQEFTNDQINFLATIGTSLFALPAGEVETVFAYEHRDEEADFVPFEANQLGLTGVGNMEVPQSGSYDTNELSAEVLVPILGGDTAFTGVEELEFNGTYRYVDNSIAGSESVWSMGLRWQVVEDLTVRVTQSRNFRAPTLTQLVAPVAVGADSIGDDPCDADNITSGPNPGVRRANCEAEWAANPQYPPLQGFQDPAENFTLAQVTTGGNPDLENEISDTTTYGLVLQPRFIPGLTFSVDRIEIDLEEGLSAFEPADFLAACYDASPQPADICGTFTRAATGTLEYPAGTVLSALSTTFNASVIEYEGEYYVLDYQLPLDDVFGTGPGQLSFTLDATHNALFQTAVTAGSTFVRDDDTIAQPDWVSRFTARWGIGPVLLSYQLFYLSDVKATPDASIENNPNPFIDSNMMHSISAQWDVSEAFSVRAGLINFTDEEPSYPTLAHGDIIGRRWFLGATARF